MTTRQTYCSKDLCLKLRKIGVDASYIMQFEKGGSWYEKYTLDVINKWLMQEHNLFVEASLYQKTYSKEKVEVFWSWQVVSTTNGQYLNAVDNLEYGSYDEARQAGIEYTIDNLEKLKDGNNKGE